MATKSQFVVPRGSKWAVRKEGSTRVTKRFDTQREAIEAAKRIARNQGAVLYIFGSDGRIRKRHALGNDTPPMHG